MNHIQHPLILEGEKVKLVPLDHQHFPALLEIARQEKIWEHYSVNGGNSDRLLLHLKSALLKRGLMEQYPFTMIDKNTGMIIGSTLFHSIVPEHRKLEIGWTWLDPAYWRAGYNRECKLLLLTYCFETLKTARVQFQTDELNVRSRKALEGIGATFEGILRKERIKENGVYRNSAMYSIIEDEWEGIKASLINRNNRS